MASGDTHPTETAAVVRFGAAGPELVHMRWGWMPTDGASPVINLRAETADLAGHRCLVPATEMEFFTGAEPPKRKWRVSLKGEPMFFFGGLWRAATAEWPESYAVLTIDAAPDILPLNDRQPAVIRPADVPTWLGDANRARKLLEPLPAGSYDVAAAD